MCNNCHCIETVAVCGMKIANGIYFGRNGRQQCHLHSDFLHVQRQSDDCIRCFHILLTRLLRIIIRLSAALWSKKYWSKLYATIYSRFFTHSHRSLLYFIFFIFSSLFVGQAKTMRLIVCRTSFDIQNNTVCRREKCEENCHRFWADLQLTDFVTVIIFRCCFGTRHKICMAQTDLLFSSFLKYDLQIKVQNTHFGMRIKLNGRSVRFWAHQMYVRLYALDWISISFGTKISSIVCDEWRIDEWIECKIDWAR